MFINELSKKESVAFLSLVKSLAEVDCAFVTEEYKLIKEYIGELGLCEDSIEYLSHEEALKILEGSNSRTKNIVYFELLGLALIDGEFDEAEIKFLDSIAETLNLNADIPGKCLNFFKDVKEAYSSVEDDYKTLLEDLKKKADEIIS